MTQQPGLDTILAGATDLLLEAAAPLPGERVLDIGCGAGASTLAFAGAVGPGGRVTGLDISAPLLERARERAGGAANVDFVLADAATYRFPPAGLDLAVSRFGLMFFEDPVAAFRNIAAGLRPGGRIVLVAWAGEEHHPWFALAREAAEARLGPGEPGPPDAPGPMAFRDTGRVTGLLAAAGLAECRGEYVPGELHHPGGLEAAVALATRIGPAQRLMREKAGDETDRAAIEADLRTRFAPFVTGDGIRVPAVFTLFRARRA